MLFRVFSERFALYESPVTRVIYISVHIQCARTTVPLAVYEMRERYPRFRVSLAGIANVSAVNPRLCARTCTFAGRGVIGDDNNFELHTMRRRKMRD